MSTKINHEKHKHRSKRKIKCFDKEENDKFEKYISYLERANEAMKVRLF